MHGPARHRRADYRAAAAALVLASGLIIFFLGLCLQLLLYEYRDACREMGSKLPALTELFFSLFVVRPSMRFAHVVWWFWWPMLWCGLHCHARCPGNAAFAIRFLYGFVACWLLVAGFLAVVGFVCAAPLIILLADVRPTAPAMETVITVVNRLLPTITIAGGAWWWALRRRRPASGPRGFEVVSRASGPSPSTPGEGEDGVARCRRSLVDASRPREPAPRPLPGVPGEGARRARAP